MKNRTTIQIPKALRKELSELRIYRRETYEEIINRIIKKSKKEIKR
jgi:hypothetical protein